MTHYDLSLKLSKHIKHFSVNDKIVINTCCFYAQNINMGNEPNTWERKTVNGGWRWGRGSTKHKPLRQNRLGQSARLKGKQSLAYADKHIYLLEVTLEDNLSR